MKNKHTAGSLDAIADGVLLNNSQAAQVLGISRVKLAEIIKENNIPTARLGKGKNSPLFVKAGDLKRFLEMAFSAVENSTPTDTAEPEWAAIVENPPAEPPQAAALPAEPTDTPAAEPTDAPAAEPTPPQSKGKKPKYLPPAERPKRVDVDFNKYVDTRGSWDFINAELAQRRKGENPKPKSADEALKKAGVKRWSKGEGKVKGYGGKS